MRVFGLTTGADTAGINYAIKGAFDRHSRWTVNAMVAAQNYIGYPVDVSWSQRELERLYDAADVVHIHNTTHAHRWYDNGQGKPTVLMHHGMHSHGDFRQMVRDGEAIGAVQVASTLDMALMEPGLTWLGAPANLDDLRRLRGRALRHEGMRVGHAPTNRAIKGTAAFIDAMGQLPGVEMVLIEQRQWRKCLALKATCDVWFDQPTLGYGSNAIEAWAMGLPVLAGVADPAIREGMIAHWGVLPFMETTEASLLTNLRALTADADLRAEYAQRGTAHVERWHDERVTVATLTRLYSEAPRTVPGGLEKRLTPDTIRKLLRHDARTRREMRRAPA